MSRPDEIDESLSVEDVDEQLRQAGADPAAIASEGAAIVAKLSAGQRADGGVYDVGSTESIEARLGRQLSVDERKAIDRGELVYAWDQIEPDARAVLLLVAQRLVAGQKAYGRLDIATDPRDFAREALEEIADGLAYAGMAAVRQARGGR